MKRATELLGELRALGVDVTLEGERLRLIAPPGRVSTELREELARHKAEIIALLEEAGAGARPAADELRPRESRGEAVLSDAQLRLWFLQQLIPGSSSYNVARAFHLRGDVDRAALEGALADLVERHEILRTTYEETDGVPRQVAHEVLSVTLRVEDLTGHRDPRAEARRLVEERVREAIDLEREAPLRVFLSSVGDREHVLLVVLHHIAADGWSLAQLYRDLGEAYRARRLGEAPRLAPLPIQYADYAEWRHRRADERARAHLEYWERNLQGLAPLDLPTDHPRPAQQTFDGVKVSALWPAELAHGLEELGRASGATLYMTLLAVFDVLLARYCAQDDVIVGSPVSSRDRTELEGLIGCFLNMVPVRVDASAEQSFTQLLSQVRTRTLEALEHRDLPFERIVGHLETERDPSRNPLFQVFFAVQNAPEEPFVLEGCEAEPFVFDRGSTEFDLDVHVWPQPGGLRVDFLYNRQLFDAATVEGMLAALRTLAEAAVAKPSSSLSELPLTTAESWPRSTPAEPPPAAGIHELFLRRAAETPEAVAVVAGEVRLSYRELRDRARAVADHLRGMGVVVGDLVGLCTDRSADMLVGLLGILETGAAYVPLDPSFPAERLAYQLEDAAPRVLVSQRALAGDLPEFAGPVLWLDALPEGERTTPGAAASTAAGDLAYVIYTSGSTGRPKGVEVTHGGVVNFLESMRAEPGLGPRDVLLAVTTLSFDIAVLELLGPLASGGSVTIAPCDVAGDGHRLAELLEVSGATVMQATPATWQMLLHAGWRGDGRLKMLCGGEALPRSLADELLARGAELWNMYGPTETTIWSAVARVEADGRPIAIGRAIANTQLLVLDGELRAVPQGVPGELHIAGAGLARGYHGRADLTARSFVPSPRPECVPGRLYKTGDLVRIDSAGRLRFLGRIDQQVKLRGYRIEPGEIESVLEEVAGVRQAAVLLDTSGEARLVAFLAPAPAAANPEELRSALQSRVPDYMLPSAFVGLDALPLTPAGKLDRRALAALPVPEAAPGAARGARSVARNPLEEAVADAFRDVLGASRTVGIHESFFELGGHSLLATQLVSRLRKLFGVELSLAEVFAAPTVAGVTRCVERARGSGRTAAAILPAAPAPQGYPLSFSQRRLWFLDQVGTGAAYHMNLALDLDGDLDGSTLVRALRAIAERHDVLRTRFVAVDGTPLQVVRGAAEWPLAELDLSGVPPAELDDYVEQAAAAASELPFDLERGPLMRATLLRLGPGRATLLLSAHHIVVDVWSLNLIARELTAHYEAFAAGEPPAVPALPIQYADFAAWQAAHWTDEVLAPQLEYWKGRLGGELPVLQLPTDRPRPPVQTYGGASRRFQVGASTGDALRALCREHGVTMAMVVQACFQALLSRLSGQDDLLLGAPVAGRTRAEVEDLLGHFVNSLVLRADLSGDPTFAELLERTRATNLEAYDHQDLPFERLVEALEPVRDPSRSPLFQVVFAMQNVPAPSPESSALEVGVRPLEATVSRHDLELFVMEADGGLRGRLVYNTDLFDAATIERTTAGLVVLLEHAARNPGTRLSELPLLTDRERDQLTRAWSGEAVEHPSDLRTVPEEIVARTTERPADTALVCGDAVLTYAELNSRANRLARTLRARGVGTDSLVGVCVDRGLDMVVALLGVWKAGGAYLPLDPDYPKARLEFMLADSQVATLVTQEPRLELLENLPANVLCLDRDRAEIEGADDGELPERAAPGDVAYAIYTSGSTGTPKAALLEHAGLWNVAHEQRRWFGVGPGTRVLQFSSVSFDAATFEVVMALASGATLFLGSRDELLPGPDLERFLRRHAIGLVTLPPTALAALPPGDYPDLATITVAGEACSSELVERWAPGRRFFNLYGPTEATIWSTVAELRPGDRPHIGTPVGNTRAYLLDGAGRPVPIGVPGELHVGGAGVARGYWNRDELTRERFLDDPFVPGGRLYATGDLARWRADGSIEFVGRADKQVKLRGHRIELEEIEAVLDRHAGVRSSLAVVREDAPGDPRLVAYVVPEVEEATDANGGAPALEDEHVDHWKTLYESSYSEADTPAERAFHIASWDSSYTGAPLPAGEMREWVDETVASIASLTSGGGARVLELGCGTGLLLFRLAPRCREYRGCDLSQAALDYVASELETVLGADAERVTLEQRAAHELTGIPEGHFDVVVLNSVVQYFPSVEYLLGVLERAARALRPGGRIFLGDVRSLPLLEAFHTSVALHSESGDFDPAALRRRALRELRQDQELVLDPRLFTGLAERLPRLRAAAVEPKRGRYDNELSRFRYDVYLSLDEAPEASGQVEWVDWDAADGLARMRERLAARGGQTLGWRGIPNARTERWARAVDLLEGPEPPRSRERLEAQLERANGTVHPDDLRALAGELGLGCSLSWSVGGERGAFDAVFRPRDAAPGERAWTPVTDRLPAGPLGNEPLHGRRMRELVVELREHATAHLPRTMVPSAFVTLDAFPVTPNGKLDRAALPPPGAVREELAEGYRAPASDLEQVLAGVWARTLGLERVGALDNFFALGGDSILGIHLVAAAREAGVHFSAAQLFQHQTVASLAAVATLENARPAEQGRVTGAVALTPIQRWFFEQEPAVPEHFNQALAFELPPGRVGRVEELAAALARLLEQHDALRARFRRTNGEWSQEFPEAGEASAALHDLSSLAPEDQLRRIESLEASAQASLDLERGPLVRAELFRRGEARADRLFLVVHHLVVDGVSWRALLEDLETLLREGPAAALPPKTESFAAWSAHLQALAEAESTQRDAQTWRRLPWDEVRALPTDRAAGPNTVGSMDRVSATLDAAETEQLLALANTSEARIDDYLLTAIARALVAWSGGELALIDVEGHGRDGALDLSRTVGWFTSMHPVLLRVASTGEAGAALSSVREQLAAVPDAGVSWGLARYLGPEALRRELAALPRAQVSYNYLGRLGATLGAGDFLKPVTRDAHDSRAPENERAHALEINGAVVEGELRVTWSFSRNLHDAATVRALADSFTRELRALSGGMSALAGFGWSDDQIGDILAELDRD